MRILILVCAATLAACTQRAEPADTDLASTEISTPQAAPTGEAAGGTPFDVPSDANARYAMLKVEPGEGGNIVATTRREGKSGTSFARREIDCGTPSFRYIGEGDTLEEAQQPAPNPGEMAPLVEGSISDVTVKVACASR